MCSVISGSPPYGCWRINGELSRRALSIAPNKFAEGRGSGCGGCRSRAPPDLLLRFSRPEDI
uniref:Uncharacterized protein n=1 Tax=Setaria digitata TaxID=48799 RepID=A0A915PM99_9BILA